MSGLGGPLEAFLIIPLLGLRATQLSKRLAGHATRSHDALGVVSKNIIIQKPFLTLAFALASRYLCF